MKSLTHNNRITRNNFMNIYHSSCFGAKLLFKKVTEIDACIQEALDIQHTQFLLSLYSQMSNSTK